MVKVHSKESEIRVSNKVRVAVDLNLPAFEHRQVEHWPSKMSWSDAMRNFAHARESYMRDFDSPEKRLREKNPAPFVLE